MVVLEKNIGRTGFRPSEGDAPLQVDADRVAARAFQRMKMVRRRLEKILEFVCSIDIPEPFERLALQIGRNPANRNAFPNLLSYFVNNSVFGGVLRFRRRVKTRTYFRGVKWPVLFLAHVQYLQKINPVSGGS